MGAVDDPNLIAQLEKSAKPAVDDPDLVAQLEKASQSSIAGDVVKSLGSGIASGVSGLVGLPEAAGYGMRYLAQKAGIAPSDPEYLSRTGKYGGGRGPTADEALGGIETLTGPMHKPETVPGEYARTIGSFLPGAMAGPYGPVRNALMLGVLPGTTSETAGQVTKGTALEGPARFVGALAPAAIPTAMNALRRGASYATGADFQNPADVAAQKLKEAMEIDARTSAGAEQPYRPLGPSAYTALQANGSPLINLDIGGETTRRLARAASNQSPEAAAMINPTVRERYRAQADRIDKSLLDVTGLEGNADDAREVLLQQARESRQPLYDAAYAEGAGGVDGKWLTELQKSPALQSAMKEGATRMLDREAVQAAGGAPTTGRMAPSQQAAEAGGKPAYGQSASVHFDELSKRVAAGEEPQSVLKDIASRGDVGKAPNGGYTLEYWDATKQALDGDIASAIKNEQMGRARELIGVRDRLVKGLDEAVPQSYANARGTAAEFFGAGNALEAGQKFASAAGRYKNESVKQALSDMTGQELKAFREGYLSRLRGELSEMRTNRNAADAFLNSPATKERMGLVFGPEQTKAIQFIVDSERRMQAGYVSQTGQSATAQFQKDIANLDTLRGFNPMSPKSYFEALAEGRRTKIANELARTLSSRDPNVLTAAMNRQPGTVSALAPFLRTLAVPNALVNSGQPASGDRRNALLR